MPPERRDEPVDDLRSKERERWQRIADAKTPEDLERALRDAPRPEPETRTPAPPKQSFLRRSALFPLLVVIALMWLVAETLTSDESDPESTPPRRVVPVDFPPVSPRSTGPVITVPYGSVVAVVAADGGQPAAVTPLGEGADDPEWRPDGRALLTATVRGLVEVPVDRNGTPQWALHRLLGDDYRGRSPEYSPDGRRIAFVAVLADIVVGDRRGTRPRLVVDRVREHEPMEFDWSRSGRLVVGASGVIFVTTPRGKLIREVISALPTAVMPAWSPDGRRIAYTQLNPQHDDGFMRVAVTEPGSRTPPGERVNPRGTTAAYPAWSPDGSAIAYARFADGTWDLFVYDLRSRRERRLTNGPGDEIDPAWSPDGRRIAFVGNLLPARH